MMLAEVAAVFKTLLVLRWKQFARAPQFGQRLAMRILAGFMGVYLLLNLLFIGYFLPLILGKSYPDASIPELVNGYILHFFLALLAMRYFMQKMPATQLQVFLTLPVRKSRLVLAYLGLLALHGFNYAPIILALPLWVQTILPVYPLAYSLLWLAGILLLSLTSAALVLLVKMFAFDRPLIFFAFLLALVALFLLDQLPVLAVLPALSGGLFNGLLAGNWMLLLAVAAGTGLLTFALFRILRGKLYLQEGKIRKSTSSQQINTANLGKSILLLRLELKLLLRNKMARFPLLNIIVLSGIGIMYLMVQGLNTNNIFGIVFGIMFLVSGVASSYVILAWKYRSEFFDGLLTRPLAFAFLNKTILMVAQGLTIVVFALLLFGTVFNKPQAAPLMIALFFYTAGLINYAFLLFGIFEKKRYPLNPPSMMNFKGTMGSHPFFQVLMLFGSMLIPLALILLFGSPSLPSVYVSIGTVGLIGLFAHKFWFQQIQKIRFYVVLCG